MSEEPRDLPGLVAVVLCVVGAVAGLAYGVWALVSRRSIFADMAAGADMSHDRMATSDTWDTVFSIGSGVIVGVAVVWWLVRALGARTRAGRWPWAALAVALIGAVTAVAGFLLQHEATSEATVKQGADASVAATIVVGVGFCMAGAALVLGAVAVRVRRERMPALPDTSTL